MKLLLYLTVTIITTMTSLGATNISIPLNSPKITIAKDKAIKFLLEKQEKDGSWMHHPAITALACSAVVRNSDGKENQQDAINKALNFILKSIQKDGSIWNKHCDKYPNYSTSVSLIALVDAKRPQDIKAMKAARKFILNSQFKDIPSTDPSYGGVGYGKKLRPDLSNTQWALEALYRSEYLDKDADGDQKEKNAIAWQRAIKFLNTCQNIESNKEVWVVCDKDNHGGFIYMPGESKAGNTDGKLKSYGSMTYAGLKSMIYAKLKKDDKRVIAAMDWVKNHYTFAENPGMGLQGHFYYLHTCAKALNVYGKDSLIASDGKKHFWRKEMLGKLISMQKEDGSWVNSNSRWFENMPVLSTAYSLLIIAESAKDASNN